MKTALGAFTALLLAGALYARPAHAQVQVQPGPGFLYRLDRERLHLRSRGIGASAKDITARDGK